MIRLPCSLCGTTDFPKSRIKRYKNGVHKVYLRKWCVLCQRDKDREWHERNRERRNAWQREFRRNNPEYVRYYHNKYYRENSERCREIGRRNYARRRAEGLFKEIESKKG